MVSLILLESERPQTYVAQSHVHGTPNGLGPRRPGRIPVLEWYVQISIVYPTPRSSYVDQDFGFATSSLYGLEHDLTILYILLYSIFDIMTGSPFSALIVTYSVDFVIRNVRYYYGRRNIAMKSMLDGRFLS